jgi:hypothetical protein
LDGQLQESCFAEWEERQIAGEIFEDEDRRDACPEPQVVARLSQFKLHRSG